VETERIIALNQYIAIHSTKVETRQITQKKAPFLVPFMKAAAVLLIAVCSAGIIRSLLQKPAKSLAQSENKTNSVNNIKDTISIKRVSNDSLINKIAINYSDKCFQKLPSFESQIGQEYRSDAVEIISPKSMKTFISSENINFQWQKKDIKSLVLSLYDNQGKLIFQKEVSSTFILKQRLQPGLYYWQLETADDIVYTGKFLVVKSESNTK
jgi:cbb3-type cytochrome oxidase subunit 3